MLSATRIVVLIATLNLLGTTAASARYCWVLGGQIVLFKLDSNPNMYCHLKEGMRINDAQEAPSAIGLRHPSPVHGVFGWSPDCDGAHGAASLYYRDSSGHTLPQLQCNPPLR
jgi:hypothetical protein